MFRKLNILAIVLFVLVSQITIVSSATSESFKDVKPSDWFYYSVTGLVKRGIVNGFSDGTFKPNQSVTRAEWIKMTAAALKLEIADRKEGQAWHVPYVNAAKAAGIYSTKDFTAGWDKPITRLETARIAVRAVDRSLKDANDKELMYEATKRGLITGVANGELGKDERSTRAQAAVIIDRVLQVLAGQTLKMDKRAASYAEVELRGTNMETMWGGKMYDLPLKEDLSYEVKGTFEQVLIIDLDDKDSPYRGWVPELLKVDGNSWKGDYLIAFKVTMENKKIIEKAESLYFHMLMGNPYMLRAIIPKEYVKSSPLALRKSISFDKLNKVTTWHLVTISKEKIAEYKDKNSFFWYFDWNIQKSFFLAPKGRVFS